MAPQAPARPPSRATSLATSVHAPGGTAHTNRTIHSHAPSSVPALVPDLAETSAKFRAIKPLPGFAKTWHQIRVMIRDMVSEPPTSEIPAYLKHAKLPLPATYDGSDDNDTFLVWLQQLLEYFVTLRLQGPEFEVTQLHLTAGALTGTAATWFYHNLQSPTRLVRVWYFEDTIVQLHYRFIHKDPTQLAAQRFHALG